MLYQFTKTRLVLNLEQTEVNIGMNLFFVDVIDVSCFLFT